MKKFFIYLFESLLPSIKSKLKQYLSATIITSIAAFTILPGFYENYIKYIEERVSIPWPITLLRYFHLNQGSISEIVWVVCFFIFIVFFIYNFYLKLLKNISTTKLLIFILNVFFIDFLIILYIKGIRFHYLVNNQIVYDWSDYFFIFFLVLSFLFLLTPNSIIELIAIKIGKHHENIKQYISSKINLLTDAEEKPSYKVEQLLPSRQANLSLLKQYISNEYSTLIGINGDWGTGKSFLSKNLKKNISNEYEIITISLLSLRIEKVQSTILSRINTILYKHGIFSSSFRGMSNLEGMGDHWYTSVLNFIFPEPSDTCDALEEITDLIPNLSPYKGIIVFFEDIDRLHETEKITLVFDIAERLSSKYLKFVFEFSYERLQAINKNLFTYSYLEKYIPFTLNITNDTFKNKLDFEKEIKLSVYPDNEEISERFNYLFNIEDAVVQQTNINKPLSFLKDEIPVRQIGHFVSDVLVFEQSNLLENLGDSEHQLINFYLFLKHCFPVQAYSIFFEVSLLDSKIFEYNHGNRSYNELFPKTYADTDFFGLCILQGFNISPQMAEAYNSDETIKKQINDINQKIWTILTFDTNQISNNTYIARSFIKIVLEQYSTDSLSNIENLIHFQEEMTNYFKNDFIYLSVFKPIPSNQFQFFDPLFTTFSENKFIQNTIFEEKNWKHTLNILKFVIQENKLSDIFDATKSIVFPTADSIFIFIEFFNNLSDIPYNNRYPKHFLRFFDNLLTFMCKNKIIKEKDINFVFDQIRTEFFVKDKLKKTESIIFKFLIEKINVSSHKETQNFSLFFKKLTPIIQSYINRIENRIKQTEQKHQKSGKKTASREKPASEGKATSGKKSSPKKKSPSKKQNNSKGINNL